MAQLKSSVGVSLATALIASGVHAGGFQLMEQNASHLGTAYAGAASSAENASTIYHNPAGLTYLPGLQLSLGGALISTHAKFKSGGVSSGGDAGVTALIPNAYIAWQASQRLSLGLGISVPFGLSTDYDRGWVGQEHALKTSIATLNVNPSVAYKLDDQWSVGGGLNYQTINASMDNMLGNGAYSKLKGDDSSWGWNAGVIYQVSPSMRLGASYRSAIQHTLVGETNTGTPVKADLKMPGTFIWSVYQQLSDRWEMMADVARVQWSTVQRFDVYNRNTGALMLSDPYGYKNTWRFSWGSAYQYSGQTKIKFGLALDETPTNNVDRSPRLPDSNRVWLSMGVQYKLPQAGVVDLGYTYVYIRDPKIAHFSSSAAASPYLRGEYDASAHILGAQYSQAF